MVKRSMPPGVKGRIKAVRGLLGALASTSKSARRAMEAAAAKHGILSDEYAEKRAQHEEADDLLHGFYRMLAIRLKELEAPYKES